MCIFPILLTFCMVDINTFRILPKIKLLVLSVDKLLDSHEGAMAVLRPPFPDICVLQKPLTAFKYKKTWQKKEKPIGTRIVMCLK